MYIRMYDELKHNGDNPTITRYWYDRRVSTSILIALCSVVIGKPVLPSPVVLGEMSITGTLINVDELANTLQVCLDSGAKKVLLPSTSRTELTIEVTSPGMLDNEITIEKMKTGLSKIRNKGITAALSYMNVIEAWGSGIPRMFREAQEYGLREPELIFHIMHELF